MVKYSPQDGKWIVREEAKGIWDVRNSIGETEYENQKKDLQKFLCEYFSLGLCSEKLGKSVCPLDRSPLGGKVLKVRWGLPGNGKSGGLRLIVVAYCDERRVVIAEAFYRKDEPSAEDVAESYKNL